NLDSRATFENGHFRHRSAAHPEGQRELLRLKRRKLDVRLSVEGGRLTGPPWPECRGPVNRTPVAVMAGGIREIGIQCIVRQQALRRGRPQNGGGRLLPGGQQRGGILFRQGSFMLGDSLLQPRTLAGLFGGGHFEDRRGVSVFPIEALLRDRVEEREEAIV